jgi:hypothetical protein
MELVNLVEKQKLTLKSRLESLGEKIEELSIQKENLINQERVVELLEITRYCKLDYILS